MGGGYIECGKFSGEDKSGSAIEGVFEGIKSQLSANELERWNKEFIAATKSPLEEMEFRIPSQLVKILEPYLRSYYEDLGAKLGYPNTYEAIQIDKRSGLNPTEAKWGAGQGWRYYCAQDLLQACEVSLQTGEDIIVSFD